MQDREEKCNIDDANVWAFESVWKVKKHLHVSTTECFICEHHANALIQCSSSHIDTNDTQNHWIENGAQKKNETSSTSKLF